MPRIIGSGPTYFTIEDDIGQENDYQKGSVRPRVLGNNVGLAEIGTDGLLDIVHPTPFDEWLDPVAVPYPDLQTLLDDIEANMYSPSPTGIADAPFDTRPYQRENGAWVSDVLSSIAVTIAGGQDVNQAGGLALVFDAFTANGLLPLVNPDFSFTPGDNFITFNRLGFIRLFYSCVSAGQDNLRKNPAMLTTVGGAFQLQTVSYAYGRNLVDNTMQNMVGGVPLLVLPGDIMNLFAIQTGSAGAALTLAGQGFVQMEYINNARA